MLRDVGATHLQSPKDKGKGRGHLIIAPLHEVTSPQKCSGMACTVKESHVLLAPMCLSMNRLNHTCLCLLTEAGPHLLTQEGWKAELA